jgi:hypothetical protein
VHKDQTFDFENPGDALKHAPNGGCKLICQDILSCGHKCNFICHSMDHSYSALTSWSGQPAMHTLKGAENLTRPHRDPYKPLHSPETICWEQCSRKCDAGIHTCRKACVVKCGSNCDYLVSKELPCGHSANVKCSTKEKYVSCKQEVEKVFPLCQHRGTVECWSNRCPSECMAQMSCGHSCGEKCHINGDPDHLEYMCKTQCNRRKKNCSADHLCSKDCHAEDCDLCVEKVWAQLFSFRKQKVHYADQQHFWLLWFLAKQLKLKRLLKSSNQLCI